MSEHTATPWRVFTTPDGLRLVGVGDKDGQGILDCGYGVWSWDTPEGVANAELVVKAVNNHEALVEALRPFAWYFDVNDCNDREDHGDAIEVPIRDLRVAFKLFKAMGLAVTPQPSDPVGKARE